MRIRILIFSSLTFKMPAKKLILEHNFLCLLLFEATITSFFFDQKESLNSRNQGFSYYFCTIIEGSGSRAGSESIPLTSGSGSGRPKTGGSGSRAGSGSATLSKSNKQKKLCLKISFFDGILKVNDENSRIKIQDPDPFVRVMDLRIRIRIHPKISWIPNTA